MNISVKKVHIIAMQFSKLMPCMRQSLKNVTSGSGPMTSNRTMIGAGYRTTARSPIQTGSPVNPAGLIMMRIAF